MIMSKSLRVLSVICILFGCSHTEESKDTLASWDVSGPNTAQADVFVPNKTEEEVKAAYYEYLQNAESNERGRLLAINRLADMEIAKANAALKSLETEVSEDPVYLESVRRTLSLLETSLKEYPDDPGSDKVLYRLARTYDQLGNQQASLAALEQLSQRFPTSDHYAEAQFRIAERAFLTGDYIAAEDAYTEVIFSPQNLDFKQRAFFKRGWARYKQSLFSDAAEDYLEAIRQLGFTSSNTVQSHEKRVYDEHFRAIGLTLAQISDFQKIQSFFTSPEDQQYLYPACLAISDIYLNQERFSDAANILNQYSNVYPQSEQTVLADLAVLNVWQTAKFTSEYLTAVENFFVTYNLNAEYWSTANNKRNANAVGTELKAHVLFVVSHFHAKYLRKPEQQTLQAALRWYERYVAQYASSARQDNIYIQYAQLLSSIGRSNEALTFYEMAAYDNGIILDRNAAYSTISESFKLFKNSEGDLAKQRLAKHLKYSLQFAQLYPNDPDSANIALHAAEQAFDNKQFREVIQLTAALPQDPGHESYLPAQLLKARSYLELGQLLEAEELFLLLANKTQEDAERTIVADNLALTLYRRGEAAIDSGKLTEAIEFYARIPVVAAESDIAPQALYDAIDLAMSNALWPTAVTHMERFQELYPQHSLADDVAKRLSSAYLNSEQYAQAAVALEKVSSQADDDEVQMTALWKAAELYEKEGDIEAAIRTYRSYAHKYTRPFPQYMEAMHKLTRIYEGLNDGYRKNFWENKITDADAHVPATLKSPRTDFITADAWLHLAQNLDNQFQSVRLVQPLADNLRRKKELMQNAIKHYSHASTYNLTDITTESTYAIARIYHQFSKDLMDSERPDNLKGEELAQYEILIEDQAFPFEEMAIEFHEINVSRIGTGMANRWISASLLELRTLFPVRYAREGKLTAFSRTL